MLNKITKVSITVLTVCFLLDISYAFGIPKIGKKEKKAAVAAVAYNLEFNAPDDIDDLQLYGYIGSYDLGVAGAPAALKVMQAQVTLAKANRKATKAITRLSEAFANKEQKAKLDALKKQLKKAKNDDERREITSKMSASSTSLITDIDAAKQEINDEQKVAITKGLRDVAKTWAYFAEAVNTMKDLPDAIEQGINECTDEISNLGADFSSLKKLKGVKANMMAIKDAVKLVPQFAQGVALQADVFKKLGAMLKAKGYKVPSIQEASESTTDLDLKDLD